jgi:DNA-nicking Smr family endonuclease
MIRKLLRAAFPETVPQLDLHGLRVPEALDLVAVTLTRARQEGVERLRIVCGKGKNSPGGVGVLREAVAGWLEESGYAQRYRRDVDADGRDGALWVDLRES